MIKNKRLDNITEILKHDKYSAPDELAQNASKLITNGSTALGTHHQPHCLWQTL